MTWPSDAAAESTPVAYRQKHLDALAAPEKAARVLRQTLSIMLNLDQPDLVSAGVLDADDQRGWEKFRDGPHRAALSLPQERMERLAVMINERLKA